VANRAAWISFYAGMRAWQIVRPGINPTVSGKRFLSPETLPAPFGYSHVVDAPARRVIYVSGQVPLDAEGHLVGEGDFQAQARQVFENLTRALEAADASWGDVVKLGYFVRDVGEIASLRAIRDEYVDTEQPPASTLVEVSGLFRDDVVVEIEAVAIRE
jgi:reactive intermediate/imine deaminase